MGSSHTPDTPRSIRALPYMLVGSMAIIAAWGALKSFGFDATSAQDWTNLLESNPDVDPTKVKAAGSVPASVQNASEVAPAPAPTDHTWRGAKPGDIYTEGTSTATTKDDTFWKRTGTGWVQQVRVGDGYQDKIVNGQPVYKDDLCDAVKTPPCETPEPPKPAPAPVADKPVEKVVKPPVVPPPPPVETTPAAVPPPPPEPVPDPAPACPDEHGWRSRVVESEGGIDLDGDSRTPPEHKIPIIEAPTHMTLEQALDDLSKKILSGEIQVPDDGKVHHFLLWIDEDCDGVPDKIECVSVVRDGKEVGIKVEPLDTKPGPGVKYFDDLSPEEQKKWVNTP